jgi:hypothetical protein
MVIIAAATALVAAADADTGFYTYESCLALKHLCDGDAADYPPAGAVWACGGYVKGAMDAMTVYEVENKVPACYPEMTSEQVILITKRWMEQHPEQLHLPAAFCISRALYEAYPACHN